MRGGRHDANLQSVREQRHSRRTDQRDLQEAAGILSGAQHRHRRADQQLSLSPESRDRQIPVHAADGLRAELVFVLDGAIQLWEGARGFTRTETEWYQAG